MSYYNNVDLDCHFTQEFSRECSKLILTYFSFSVISCTATPTTIVFSATLFSSFLMHNPAMTTNVANFIQHGARPLRSLP